MSQIEWKKPDILNIPANAQLQIGGTDIRAQLAKLTAAAPVLVEGVSFTEDGSTVYTATVEVAAGTLVHDVGFANTVLWDDSGAVALIVGDDDDDNGWFASTNLKATDLVPGEVLAAADDGTWGGVEGAYLTAAGRRGRTTAGVDSGWYFGAASEIIFKVTAANGDGSAGRSFGWVRYSVPTFTASTNT